MFQHLTACRNLQNPQWQVTILARDADAINLRIKEAKKMKRGLYSTMPEMQGTNYKITLIRIFDVDHVLLTEILLKHQTSVMHLKRVDVMVGKKQSSSF